jgi:cytochrome c biogenesis protein CcdA/thiol-disulfide isomerase/thioredoxin
MVLLLVFALLAGFATCLSPCVLPVLPAALAVGATGGRRRPLGVVTGLVLSFTFSTIALVYVIAALGLPDDLLRTLAVLVLIGFGLSLIVPALSDPLEAWLSRFGRAPRGAARGGFTSGVPVGFSLGFLYAPCAGPILAGVITVSAAQTFTAARLAVALSYALGSGVALYGLMLGGRRLVVRLSHRVARVQQVMGVVMIAVAGLVIAHVDIRFQNAIASKLPGFLTDPASKLERSRSVADALARARGRRTAEARGGEEADAGRPLPVLGIAPDFGRDQHWFNTPGERPLTIRELRGRVVLVDFWTYTCINCIRTLPHLKALDEKYRRRGLTVVGVHTPEFPFEKKTSNVKASIEQNGLAYPVVQDNDYATWDAYGNQFWPADYLVDARGRIRYVHFGEGAYATGEKAVRRLLEEEGQRRLGEMTHARVERASRAVRTPESYLGSARAQRFANGPIVPGSRDYHAPPARLHPNALAYAGLWTIRRDSATAGTGAELALDFTARRVYLVLGSARASRAVRVLLDGRSIPASVAGRDVRGGVARVGDQRLYRLVDLPRAEHHVLTVLPAAGVSGYAFTFG